VDPSEFDRITVESLRRRGAFKWTAYPEAIGAFVAEMDFGVAAPIARELGAAVEIGSFGYLPAALSRGLSEACAAWSRDRYGWPVLPDDVRPVADVVQVLEIAIAHLTPPGSPVILPTPAYMPFVTGPPALGRDVLQVPMAQADGRAVYDLEALDAAFAAGGHLLVLCNPHNPIGRVLEREEMLAVAAVVERHGGRVFSDEIHAPLVHPGHRHVPYASLNEITAGHTITAVSASKAWNLPGLKCAQAILSSDGDRETWQRLRPRVEQGAANLGVLANTVAYTEGGPWLAGVLEYLDRNRASLSELLPDLLPEVGYREPEGTYLAWLDFRTAFAARGLEEGPAEYFLDRAKVAMTDGGACGEAGRGFARLNIATPGPILVRALEQLGKAMPPIA
jgi:cystathionine beta-lyase